MKYTTLIYKNELQDILDMCFCPITDVNGDIWTAADVVFERLPKTSLFANERLDVSPYHVMYCDQIRAEQVAANVCGWHLPTHNEALRLINALKESDCRFSGNYNKDFSRFIDISHIGNDYGMNFQFNGYKLGDTYTLSQGFNRFWIVREEYTYSRDDNSVRISINTRSQLEPLVSCIPKAQLPLRLVKDNPHDYNK